MATEKDIEAFRLMVRRLILTGSPVGIDNGSPEHAKVILEEMFKHVQKTAYVFCGCISLSVWGSQAMASNIEEAIVERNVDVRFIVQNPDKIPADSPTVKALRRHPGSIITSPLFKNFEAHFSVFDQKMYRIEKDDGAKTAVACANSPANAMPLHQLAQGMIEISTEA